MKPSDSGIAAYHRPTRRRRTGLAAVAVLLGGVLTLTACGGDKGNSDATSGSGTKGQAAVDEAAAKDASDARIVITPKTGADNVSINSGAMVKVSSGTLTKVTMTTVDGNT